MRTANISKTAQATIAACGCAGVELRVINGALHATDSENAEKLMPLLMEYRAEIIEALTTVASPDDEACRRARMEFDRLMERIGR